jgi:hypothetical protein
MISERMPLNKSSVAYEVVKQLPAYEKNQIWLKSKEATI